MAYNLYIGGVLFPMPPDKIQIASKGQNKTVNLINDGEVNLLKKEGLKELSFDVLLPNVQYPFAVYPDGFQKAEFYTNHLQDLMDSEKPFQFILVRNLPQGDNLGNTNIKCSLESWTTADEAKSGFDQMITIKLKQYKDFGVKSVTLSLGSVIVESKRETANAPETGTKGTIYKVKDGDCLWKIAKTYYGNGTSYEKIVNANSDKITNPNLIYPGQELLIP